MDEPRIPSISDVTPLAPAPAKTAKRSHKKKKPAPRSAAPKPAAAAAPVSAAPTATPAKRTRPRDPQLDTLRKGLETFPSIDILERRLLNPEGTPSEPIRLQGQSEPMEIRWINTAIPNRYHDVTRYGGYVPVKVSELADPKEVSDLTESPDGFVTRGERGAEVLMKIPKRYYDAIQQKRAVMETKKLRNSARIKADIAEAAAGQSHTYTDPSGTTRSISGDEAASGVASFFGDVQSFRETIQFSSEEAGAE